MTKQPSHICVFVFTALLIGCQQEQIPDQTARQSARVEVKRIIDAHNASLMKWYAEGLVDSVANIFAEDAWQMPPHVKPLVGREAIRAFWKQAVTWGKWRFTLSAQNVEVDGSIAAERGTYILSFTPGPNAPKGIAASADTGNYLVQWRKENGVWRVAVDSPVSEVPMPAPPPKHR